MDTAWCGSVTHTAALLSQLCHLSPNLHPTFSLSFLLSFHPSTTLHRRAGLISSLQVSHPKVCVLCKGPHTSGANSPGEQLASFYNRMKSMRLFTQTMFAAEKLILNLWPIKMMLAWWHVQNCWSSAASWRSCSFKLSDKHSKVHQYFRMSESGLSSCIITYTDIGFLFTF